MNTYKWSGRTREESPSGAQKRPTADDLASMLMSRGVIPLSIEADQPKGQSVSLLRKLVRFKPAVSTDLTLLCRQMATITKAGVPLLSALGPSRQASTTRAFAKH